MDLTAFDYDFHFGVLDGVAIASKTEVLDDTVYKSVLSII
jgi:hypothetical protein